VSDEEKAVHICICICICVNAPSQFTTIMPVINKLSIQRLFFPITDELSGQTIHECDPYSFRI